MRNKYSAYALLVTAVIVVVSWLSLFSSSSNTGGGRWGGGSAYSGGGYSGGSYGGGHK